MTKKKVTPKPKEVARISRDVVQLHTDDNKLRINELDEEKNLEEILGILELFPHDLDSHERVNRQVSSILLRGESHSTEQREVARFLGLGPDQRRWIQMGSQPESDEMYKTMVTHIMHHVQIKWGTPDAIPTSLIGELIDYENYKSGRITVDGNQQKLFKFIKNNKLCDEQILKAITTSKTSNQEYLCISNNPMDIMMASTGQNFGSCVRMNSDYSKAFYLGLPNLFIDPNTVIVFLTTKEIATSIISTPWEDRNVKTFKYSARTWAILQWDWTLQLVRTYPHESLVDSLANNMNSAGIKTTTQKSGHVYYGWSSHSRQQKFGSNKTITNELYELGVPRKNPSLSKFIYAPLRDSVYHHPLSIYNDYHQNTLTQEYDKNRIKELLGIDTLDLVRITEKAEQDLGKQTLLYHTRGGSYGDSPPHRANINYKGGFNNLKERPEERVKQFFGDIARCSECSKLVEGRRIRKDKDGNKICTTCFKLKYKQCPICNETFLKTETSDKKNAYGEFICKPCEKNLIKRKKETQCKCCKKYTQHGFNSTPYTMKNPNVCEHCVKKFTSKTCVDCGKKGLLDTKHIRILHKKMMGTKKYNEIYETPNTKTIATEKFITANKKVLRVNEILIEGNLRYACNECLDKAEKGQATTRNRILACNRCNRIMSRDELINYVKNPGTCNLCSDAMEPKLPMKKKKISPKKKAIKITPEEMQTAPGEVEVVSPGERYLTASDILQNQRIPESVIIPDEIIARMQQAATEHNRATSRNMINDWAQITPEETDED